MSHSQLPSIDLSIREKLNDREYRQSFFLIESSALIAKQLIALRKRRDLDQTEVASALHTGQPAISRVERADYGNWSFNTLRKLAELYDARIRVIIEASEDVLGEYQPEDVVPVPELATQTDDLKALVRKILGVQSTQPQPDPGRLKGKKEPSAATAGTDEPMLESAKPPSLTLIDYESSLARIDFGRKSERPKGIKILEGAGAPWN